MDKDGYPEVRELNVISRWAAGNSGNFHLLMGYLKKRWKYADAGYWLEIKVGSDIAYEISTAGWSGNEDLIGAMKKNTLFWMTCWLMSKRGGNYEFRIKKDV
jgi:hypothetical protein